MMLIHKKNKLSQAAWEKIIGTSGNLIGKCKYGDIKPSIDMVATIRDALEVSVDYLKEKTKLILNKETLQRIEDISNLEEEN